MNQQEQSQHSDFVVGNMAEDLMLSIFRMMGKKNGEGCKFPKNIAQTIYDSYSTTVVDICKCICAANETHYKNNRINYIEEAMGLMKHLSALIETSHKQGWISDKQYEGRFELIGNLYWKTHHWYSGEIKK